MPKDDATKPQDPLGEVFGYPPEDQSDEADRHRSGRLCPFNNGSANCTKDKADNPLGVCSVRVHGTATPIITCPTRFREKWRIASDAAGYFFPSDAQWTTVSEVRLRDAKGHHVGNIDHVLVRYDDEGQVVDFGTVEVQSVYVSGNVREPFEQYTSKGLTEYQEEVASGVFRVRPDYLSSRKRLVPQLASKGAILNSWGKKQAIVVDSPFFESFPEVTTYEDGAKDLAWFVYGLHQASSRYALTLDKRIVTDFARTLAALNRTDFEPGPMEDFVEVLQERLTEQLRTGAVITLPGSGQ